MRRVGSNVNEWRHRRPSGAGSLAAVALAASVLLGMGAASAQQARPSASAGMAIKANANTIMVMAGTPDGPLASVATDLARVLDSKADLRVLPVIGAGPGRNARDLLFLRGIDLGFVGSDALAAMKADPKVGDVSGQLVYVARLFNNEVQLIAGPAITDVKQLAGKKVNFGQVGSSADAIGKPMFAKLGIKVEALNLDQPAALAKLRAGEIDAVLFSAAKPTPAVARIDGAAAHLHLVDIPYSAPLQDFFLPSALGHSDYPGLVPDGRTVHTVATSIVLAAYNWPKNTDRYRRVATFVDAFFSNFGDFLKAGRNPKWREVNLAATLPGWTRAPAAAEWLAKHADAPATAKSN
ncbi:MAG: hypothetical protein KGI57_09675 [Hyphomicrobiales bacterium]|nr:hypothetical protein [Hyphomicrobiales bacterium]MDE2017963.1 hypothetical protein [Hyphomicrobiales bacterium]